jgi:hypothetical protein
VVFPLIIDYGRSHVIYNDEHFGTIIPFELRRYQDCFSLLSSVISEILIQPRQLSRTDEGKLIYTINFFTGTSFHREQIKNLDELTKFVSHNKKYNEMIYGSKCGLEQKDPTDLFFYLSSLPTNLVKITQIQYPTQLHMSLAPIPPYNIDKHPDISSCIDILHKCKSTLSFTTLCNVLHIIVINTINSDSLSPAEKEKYITFVKDLDNIFTQNISKKNRKLKIKYHDPYEKTAIANYQPKSFEQPGKILTILQGLNTYYDNSIITMREMLLFNLLYDLPYKIPDSNNFFRNYNSVLSVSPIVIKNFNANINTLKFLSKAIFSHDLKEFSKMESKPSETIHLLKLILDTVG